MFPCVVPAEEAAHVLYVFASVAGATAPFAFPARFLAQYAFIAAICFARPADGFFAARVFFGVAAGLAFPSLPRFDAHHAFIRAFAAARAAGLHAFRFRRVSACDAFVLLLGYRCGWVPIRTPAGVVAPGFLGMGPMLCVAGVDAGRSVRYWGFETDFDAHARLRATMNALARRLSSLTVAATDRGDGWSRTERLLSSQAHGDDVLRVILLDPFTWRRTHDRRAAVRVFNAALGSARATVIGVFMPWGTEGIELRDAVLARVRRAGGWRSRLFAIRRSKTATRRYALLVVTNRPEPLRAAHLRWANRRRTKPAFKAWTRP
jgi:hypothetical protein